MSKDKACDTKQKLLEAAVEVFSEKGFDGARVDEIAARAQVNKAMLYYYFDSKEKLLAELVRNYKEDVKKLKENIVKNIDLDDDNKIDAMFEGMYDFMCDRKDILRIIMIESLKATSTDVTIFSSLLPSIENKLINLRNKGIEVEDTVSLMINSFFFMMLPAAGYIILGDRLADFYGFDKEETRAKFLKTFKQFRKDIIHGKMDVDC